MVNQQWCSHNTASKQFQPFAGTYSWFLKIRFFLLLNLRCRKGSNVLLELNNSSQSRISHTLRKSSTIWIYLAWTKEFYVFWYKIIQTPLITEDSLDPKKPHWSYVFIHWKMNARMKSKQKKVTKLIKFATFSHLYFV